MPAELERWKKAAISAAISTVDDDGLPYRTDPAPSDHGTYFTVDSRDRSGVIPRKGRSMADNMQRDGVRKIETAAQDMVRGRAGQAQATSTE